jgi:hypothetical protein
VAFCNSDLAYAASCGSSVQFGVQQPGTYLDSQASFATLFTGMQQLSGQLSFTYEIFSNDLACIKLEIDSLKRKYDDFEKRISQLKSASFPFSPLKVPNSLNDFDASSWTEEDEKEFSDLLQVDESTSTRIKASRPDPDDSKTVVWTEEDENELHLLLESDWSTFTVQTVKLQNIQEMLQHQSHSSYNHIISLLKERKMKVMLLSMIQLLVLLKLPE